MSLADAQTGKLDEANASKAAALDIVDTCEARYAALVKAVNKRPWWKLF